MGEHEHYYAHCRSNLLMQGLCKLCLRLMCGDHEGGGGGVMATCSDCRGGPNSSGDPLTCWELVLGKGVRLLVGLTG